MIITPGNTRSMSR